MSGAREDAGGRSCEADVIDRAVDILAAARRECARIGIAPRDYAELVLPEALLAMMVAGMRQEEVQAEFARYRDEETPEWFIRVKRTAGYCDCQREALAEHAGTCASRAGTGAIAYGGIEQRLSAEAAGRPAPGEPSPAPFPAKHRRRTRGSREAGPDARASSAAREHRPREAPIPGSNRTPRSDR